MNTKRNTAILSSLAMVAVAMLFATGPLVANHHHHHHYYHKYHHHN